MMLFGLLFLAKLSQSLSEFDSHLSLDENEDTCLMSFRDVENSVRKNSYNIESIDEGFFPLNAHPSFWVEVNYYFSTNTTFHGPILLHPAAFEAKGDADTPDFKFQWVESPILHYIGPEPIEILSGVSAGFSQTQISIVIDPICGNNLVKNWIILKKLTAKLQHLSSVENSMKRNGFVGLLSKDLRNQIEQESNNTIPIDTTSILILIPMVISQFVFFLAWMILVPVFLQKLHLLPFTPNAVTDTKSCLFRGFMIVTFLLVIPLYAYDLFLYANRNKIMPANVTLQLICFVFNNIWFANYCTSLPACKNGSNKKRVFKRIHLLPSVVLTLFLQELTFHAGWLALMSIVYPARVGILCVNILGLYLAASLLVGGLIMMCSRTGSRKAKGMEIIGGALLLIGIICISLAYQAIIAIVGWEYRDGVSAIMPSFMPIIIFGLLTWVFGGFRSNYKIYGTQIEDCATRSNHCGNNLSTKECQSLQNDLKELPV